MIATDQDSARAYAALLAKISGEKPTVVLSDEKAGLEEDRRVHRQRRRAGWSRSGWSRRASTYRGWRSASTRRRPPPRCSSPRPSAGSSGPAPAARPRRSSCRRCPSLLGFASELEAQRDHVLGRTITDEDDIFAAEHDLLDAGATRGRAPPTSWSCSLRGARLRGPLRPRALRRRRVRPRGRGARRARRRRWTSSASPACSSPTRCASCSTTGRAERAEAAARSPSRTPVAAGVDPRAARRAAARAQRPGRRLAPPHRPGARHHPRRAAQGVRRPGRGHRQRRPAAGPDRPDPGVGRPQDAPDRLPVERRRHHRSLPTPPAHGDRDLADPGPGAAGADGAGGHAGRADGHRARRRGSGSTARSSTGWSAPSSSTRWSAATGRAGCTSGWRAAARGGGAAGAARGGRARCCARWPSRSGCTAHLTIADGDEALALAVIEPSWTDFHVSYRVGARHPLDRGAAGRAILAAPRARRPAVRRDDGRAAAGRPRPGRAGARRRRARGQRRDRHARRHRRRRARPAGRSPRPTSSPHACAERAARPYAGARAVPRTPRGSVDLVPVVAAQVGLDRRPAVAVDELDRRALGVGEVAVAPLRDGDQHRVAGRSPSRSAGTRGAPAGPPRGRAPGAGCPGRPAVASRSVSTCRGIAACAGACRRSGGSR